MTNSKLKDSNIEWLGKIPSNWNLIKGKYLFTLRTTKGNTKQVELLSPTQEYGVIPQKLYEKLTGMRPVKLKSNTDLNQMKSIYKGDFCISLRSFQGGFEYSNYNGIVSPAYQVFYPSKQVNRNYFKYLFKDKSFIQKLNSYTMSLRDGKNIAFSDFGNTYLPFPALDEQNKIADFLDKKVSQIDNLSKNIQQEITDLEEYRRSIITKAVTKGIDKNIPMKDSGIDWIGKIPQDFNIVRLKFMLETPLKYGANESGIDYDPNLPRYIRITDITSDSKLKEENKLSLSSTQAMGYILKNNTILFARSGATVGKTFLYKSTMGEAAFAGYLIAAKINESKINPKWIYYYTKSNAYWNWVNQAFSQATIQNIGAEKYSNLLLTVPKDKNQQSRIISKLDRMNAKIDRVIKKKQKLLNYLDKYKQSIIYEYVTGKKQVSSKESAKA